LRVLELAAENREKALVHGARSTSTTLLTPSRPKEDNMTTSVMRTIATGGAARSSGNDPEDLPPPKNPVRRV
jgi:hypothetical protein